MFGSSKILYIVVAEKIAAQILTGLYKPGDKMSTVRELAHEFGVNPLTIQKAYALLEEQNMVIAKVGSGKYVTNDVTVIDKMKVKMLSNVTDKYIKSCSNYGLSKSEIIKLIKEHDVTD